MNGPTINDTDIARFRQQLYTHTFDFNCWSSLWPDIQRWDDEPPIHRYGTCPLCDTKWF